MGGNGESAPADTRIGAGPAGAVVTHQKMVFLLQHDLASRGVVGTIGLVDGKLFLLLFRIEVFDSPQNTIARLARIRSTMAMPHSVRIRSLGTRLDSHSRRMGGPTAGRAKAARQCSPP